MITLVQTLMDRVYEFREQSVKAKQELGALQEENKELKVRIEQVCFLLLQNRPYSVGSFRDVQECSVSLLHNKVHAG